MSSDEVGYSIGRTGGQDFDSDKYYGTFGERVSKKPQMIVSDDDIAGHVYITGSTGSGKTSVIKTIAKHLERRNSRLWSKQSGLASAFIFIDPKGDDAEAVARQCDESTIKDGRLHYMDPAAPGFSLNLLELPQYGQGNRNDAVSFQLGFMSDIIKDWCLKGRVAKVVSDVLEYMYLNNDAPTLDGLYKLLLDLPRVDGLLKTIYTALGRPDSELKLAVGIVTPSLFEPVLNRLEKFVVDPTLYHMFCQRKSTVNFHDLIEAGHYTVVRFSESDIPLDSIDLAMQTFVMKLWFEVLNRSTTESLKERTQVILALDEFQKISSMPIMETMIKQGRSKGLGLVLAHQTLSQISDHVFDVITGNFTVQMSGRLDGISAAKLADVWDPKNASRVTKMIYAQPAYSFVGKVGKSPVIRFGTRFDPEHGATCRPNLTDEEWKNFNQAKRTDCPATN